MKKILVPFSGGLDSTYLIYSILKETQNKVEVVYFEIENNKAKTEIEKKHKEKLLNLFREEFGYGRVNENDLDYSVKIKGHYTNWKFVQPPIWVLGLQYALKPEIDEIALGYVMNDDIISYLKEIKKLYKALQPFHYQTFPKIKFPLKQLKKEEILDKLPEKYLQYCYSCENPEIFVNTIDKLIYKPCENCVPCKRYKRIKEESSHLLKNLNLNQVCIIEKFPLNFSFQSSFDFEKDLTPSIEPIGLEKGEICFDPIEFTSLV